MPRKVQFGVYELDLDAMELRKYGSPIRLQEQPCRVLASLVERPGQIVTRQELQELIWPKDTFVDFDQSLNKAVNRLRSTLNDDPGRPRYIETIPRRGYRFIAPVTGAPAIDVVQPVSNPARFRLIAAAITTAIVLAFLAAFLFLRKPVKPSLFAPARMTRDGTSMDPALSRDGKLLAYCSSAGGNVAHIWVRQTAGGEPIQVTNGNDGDRAPSFSPDGTQIAFESQRDGGGIYVMPSFGGEPRLVTKDASFPRFSPDGETLLCLGGPERAFIVPARGGERIRLKNPIFMPSPLLAPIVPIWSPTGRAILFYGSNRPPQQGQQARWRINPLDGSEPKAVSLQNGHTPTPDQIPIAYDWTQSEDGRQWIVYSAPTGDSRSLFRIAISPRGETESKPERLTSGTGLISGASLSEDGRLAFTSADITERIYVVPIGTKRGMGTPGALDLTGTEGIRNLSPSLSRDGRWMAYATEEENNSQTKIRLKDLVSGTDRVVAEKSDAFDRDFLSISPDGSKIVFGRLDTASGHGHQRSEISSYIVSAAGGAPEKICESCLPRGFSSDGSLVLMQEPVTDASELDRIAVLNLVSKTQKIFLSDPGKRLYHAFFSWDDHWVVFKRALDGTHSELVIAPVRNSVAGGQNEWVAVTDGKYSDDKPQFSADGNTLYFTSNRDGYLCIWAVRLNRATKRPEGAPFPIQHFHNAEGWYSMAYNSFAVALSVAREKMVTNLVEPRSDIWMMKLE